MKLSRFALLAAGTLFLTACPQQELGKPPTISQFAATPGTITPGSESILSWQVEGAERLELDPGDLDVSAETDYAVSPAASTTYRLTAANAYGSSSAQTGVTVAGTPALEVALTGLEATTYVSGTVTFTVAVVGGIPDSLELRRDGELFQVLTDSTFTWDTTSTSDGTYGFVARARLGGAVFDSPVRRIVVDHTPPTVNLSVTPSATPLVLPGEVGLEASAEDAAGVVAIALYDGDLKLGDLAASPYVLTLTLTQADRGVHSLRAEATDLAGNVAGSSAQIVTAYVRQTLTLESEAALDGCVEYGYNLDTYKRIFDTSFCTFNTSYPILHFFSFDRSALPDKTIVEEADLRFAMKDVSAYEVMKFASVVYARAEDAPPDAFTAYPYVSAEVEGDVTLAKGSYGVADRQRLDVSPLVQADVAAGRTRSQFRLRTPYNGPGGLGGYLYFAEAGGELAPQLELKVLAP